MGISNYHTRKHLLRSVYEGVTFCHRYHLERLLRTRKDEPKSIRLAGGAAHVDTDVCGCDETSGGKRGCE